MKDGSPSPSRSPGESQVPPRPAGRQLWGIRRRKTHVGGFPSFSPQFFLAGVVQAIDIRCKMFSDLLVYRTPKFQRAQMVLALLQLVLKKAGLHDDARRFEGLDLTNPEMANVALEILNAMNVPAKSVREHTMAVAAIREALQPTVATN